MSADRVSLAARNNALWCDGMCRAHGVASEMTDDLWICRGTPPRFHSSATTLAPGAEESIRRLEPAEFKDGFYDIELPGLGYSLLFEAEWILRESFPSSPTHLDWRVMATDQDLLGWEAGWARGDDEAAHHPRQFPPSLLEDRGTRFLAGYREGRLGAGCILNLTEPVVGISNTFNLYPGDIDLWHDLARLPVVYYPGHPATGYERGTDLEQAKAAGFSGAGGLRVWTRYPS